MVTLSTFSIGDMLDSSSALRTMGAGADSMETAAQRTVDWLRANLLDQHGLPAVALARVMTTVAYCDLPADLAARAVELDAAVIDDPTRRCAVLVGTAGIRPEWNHVDASADHRVIPLAQGPDGRAHDRGDEVRALLGAIGFDPADLPDHLPDPTRDRRADRRPGSSPSSIDAGVRGGSAFRLLYVSADIADQQSVAARFVAEHDIRSVLTFGNTLADGSPFAVLLLSTDPLDHDLAELFSSIGLSIRLSLLPFTRSRVFSPHRGAPAVAALSEHQMDAARADALEELLDVRATAVKLQAERLVHSESVKTAIIESALDGIVGMDADGIVTDFNRAAETVFGIERSAAIGMSLSEVMIPERLRPAHQAALTKYLATGSNSILGRRVEVTAMHRSGREFPAELSVVRVPGSEPAMFSGHVRDISDRVRHERELLASRARLAHIADTLQSSLLPPELPQIPGLELAARYRPVTDGLDVGGDFYDVFELADGSWAFTLGDVCGKGAGAATITALARYTLRASAIRNPGPADVLSRLNDAVHRQHPEQFCTAVYANAWPATGRVAMALGGHPPPLVVRAGGSVESVGTPGRLLGPFPEWRGASSTVLLEPGDLLLCYTDGLTEARRNGQQFGERRLMDALSQYATLGVEALIKSVEAEVIAFAGELSDDLAMLAFRRGG